MKQANASHWSDLKHGLGADHLILGERCEKIDCSANNGKQIICSATYGKKRLFMK